MQEPEERTEEDLGAAGVVADVGDMFREEPEEEEFPGNDEGD